MELCWSDYTPDPDDTIVIAYLESPDMLNVDETQEEIDARENALVSELETFLAPINGKNPWVWYSIAGATLVIPAGHAKDAYRALAVALHHYDSVVAVTQHRLRITRAEAEKHNLETSGAEALERILVDKYAAHRRRQEKISRKRNRPGLNARLIPFHHAKTIVEDPTRWHLREIGYETANDIVLERTTFEKLNRVRQQRRHRRNIH